MSAERVGLVGKPDVERIAVEFGVDRDGLDPEFTGGADDSDGDLAAVGNQDLLEHKCQCWPMSTDQPRFIVEVVEETGSTNADLLAAAASGAPDGTVLRAVHQTAGRGRLDRVWEAPPGANLLVSFLFRRGLDQPHRLTHRVAVAAAVAAERLTGLRVDLKWPNDLLVDGKKLGGILTQVGGHAGGVDYVVPGLGLNVRWAPPGAACLGPDVDPADVLDALLAALAELGDDHDDEYRRRLVTIGQHVRVEMMTRDIIGTAVDVLADGRLVVRPDGDTDAERATVIIDTGDVVHLRPLS